MRKWEKRKKAVVGSDSKSSPLPVDYLRLVETTLTEALAPGLEELKKIHPVSEFYADGALFADEALLVVTLSHGPSTVAATTVYVSADYNPLLQHLNLETTLGTCVDVVGSVFEYYLDPKSPQKIAQIAHQSLGEMEDAPFDWTKTGPAWAKLDKTNPRLEQAAEEFLMKNDPDYRANLENELTGELGESEEFLNDRLEAIKKAKSGQGNGPSGQNGPIRH